jgi:choline dehydrogenase-like flavoprotein
MLRAMVANGLDIANVDPGQPGIPADGGIWRTHSIFEPVTGIRRAADTLLDRNNENLEIRIKAKVDMILFDGEKGVPIQTEQDVELKFNDPPKPTARCIRFVGGGVECVKRGGRIFLSAGAFHTPELLMKSGIGPDGNVVDNSEVRIKTRMSKIWVQLSPYC